MFNVYSNKSTSKLSRLARALVLACCFWILTYDTLIYDGSKLIYLVSIFMSAKFVAVNPVCSIACYLMTGNSGYCFALILNLGAILMLWDTLPLPSKDSSSMFLLFFGLLSSLMRTYYLFLSIVFVSPFLKSGGFIIGLCACWGGCSPSSYFFD